MHFLEFKFPKLVQTKTVLVTRGMSECNRLDTPTGRNPLGSTLEGLPFQDKRGKCTVMIGMLMYISANPLPAQILLLISIKQHVSHILVHPRTRTQLRSNTSSAVLNILKIKDNNRVQTHLTRWTAMLMLTLR